MGGGGGPEFYRLPMVKRREILMGMAKQDLLKWLQSGRVLSEMVTDNDNGGQRAADGYSATSCQSVRKR